MVRKSPLSSVYGCVCEWVNEAIVTKHWSAEQTAYRGSEQNNMNTCADNAIHYSKKKKKKGITYIAQYASTLGRLTGPLSEQLTELISQSYSYQQLAVI